MARVDTSELDDVIDNLARLDESISRKTREETAKQTRQLVRDIRETIISMGLVGDPSDKNQVALKDSFEATNRGTGKFGVRTTAPHAAAIEEGSEPHPIEPNGDYLLSWEPEKSSRWRGVMTEGKSLYDKESGRVFIDAVSHPGNDGYHYIRTAQEKWKPLLGKEINRSVEQALRQAGFTRSGTSSIGLDADPDFIGGGML